MFYNEDCSCSSCECTGNRLSNKSFEDLIKRTKLDEDFILSVNNYLDRLKSDIYKDLIRRETLLRNGKNHTRNLISLIRCICKISYEQANEIHKNSNASMHPGIYTMTAIDYILQNNLPQKKPLLNYVLNEYISMWLHENLRIIQEDLSIIVENGTKNQFLLLSNCLLHKLESICAINWERLQMIQNYRLTYFDQLMKPMDNNLILLFGNASQLTMKRSEIPITLLYSNRTDNELININEVDLRFRKSIARILHSNFNETYRTFTSKCEKPISTEANQPEASMGIKHKQNTSNSIHTHQSSSQDPLIDFLIELANSSLSMNQSFQSESHSNSITEKTRLSQTYVNVKDPLVLTKFTPELPNMNKSLKKDDHVDQNRIFIEVTHDPSKCSPKSQTDSYQEFNDNYFNNKYTPLLHFNNQQRWYWKRSIENSRSKDCSITANSLSCSTEKSSDKNTYSINIEHNEEFR